MQTFDDKVYDNIAWYHPRFGPLTPESILRRVNHNGFPEATRQDIIDALDRLAVMGAINKGWY